MVVFSLSLLCLTELTLNVKNLEGYAYTRGVCIFSAIFGLVGSVFGGISSQKPEPKAQAKGEGSGSDEEVFRDLVGDHRAKELLAPLLQIRPDPFLQIEPVNSNIRIQ